MKLFALVLASLAVFNVALAQTAPSSFETTTLLGQSTPTGTLVVKERGAAYRVYERVVEDRGAKGEIIQRAEPAYTELASGLHYWEDGQWKETEEVIEVFPGGAIARKGPHKVIFAQNLASLGAIDLEMADGRGLRSHVLGLSFYDTASGKGALLAEVKDSAGKVLPPNQVVYEDAFTGIKADVRYTYKKGSFEQDVILRAQLPHGPEEYGLNPQTTRLVFMTEFLEPLPAVVQSLADYRRLKTGRASTVSAATAEDVMIDFGRMKIAPGKAFSSADETASPAEQLRGQVRVIKRWGTVDGRTLLFEEVPLPSVVAQLVKLPRQAGVQPKSSRTWVAQWDIPRAPAPAKDSRPLITAQTRLTSPGYVIDYALVDQDGDYVFKGNTTYYVTGNYYVNAVFEGGTVIKMATNNAGFMAGSYNWPAPGYLPVVITSVNDNSVGETIPGSTGNPQTDGNWYLWWADTISNARVSYAGLVTWYDGFVNIYDSQFVSCGTVAASLSAWFNNVLLSKCGTGWWDEGGCDTFALTAQNVTVDGCGIVSQRDWDCGSSRTNFFYNCLITQVDGITNKLSTGTNLYNFTNSTVVLAGSSGVYQQAGAGYYYLATNSPYRNAGTTNIDGTLLATLRKRTTYPPVVYSNQTFTSDLTLAPQAQRDVDAPDLGYHYEPLDFIAHNVTLTNGSLTLTGGVAVASYNNTGIATHNAATITSAGTVTQPIWITRYNCVQEQPVNLGGASALFVNPYHVSGFGPVGSFRHTKFTALAAASTSDSHLYHGDYNWSYTNLFVRDCEFFNAYNILKGTSNTLAVLQNNLFRRSSVVAATSPGWSNWLALSNNLILSTTLQLGARSSSNQWYAFNNALDDTVILSTNYFTVNGNNAYINCSNRLSRTSGSDLILTNFAYDTGPLGNFYHASTNLLNAGSQAANLVSLYHYATTTNQVKEANTTVDIGYHYVAVNSSGKPADDDNDGIPDYLEDANGNGVVDSGETSWQWAYDWGLRVRIVTPRSGSYAP